MLSFPKRSMLQRTAVTRGVSTSMQTAEGKKVINDVLRSGGKDWPTVRNVTGHRGRLITKMEPGTEGLYTNGRE